MATSDPIQAVLLARSKQILPQLEAGGFWESPQFPSMILMVKVWDEMKRIMGFDGITRYHPIWEKGRLEQLGKLQGFAEWYTQGIYYLHQLYSNSHLKTFEDIRAEFGIQSSRFYQYLQLRHT